VKCKIILLEKFETVQELLTVLKEFFEIYNFGRSHQSLAGKACFDISWVRDIDKKVA